MLGVSLIMKTHYLSMYKESRSVIQKKRKTSEEKHNASRNETNDKCHILVTFHIKIQEPVGIN